MKIVNFRITELPISKTETATMIHSTTMEIPVIVIDVPIAISVNNQVITVVIPTEKKTDSAITAAEWMKKTVMAMVQKVNAEHSGTTIRIQEETAPTTMDAPDAETD